MSKEKDHAYQQLQDDFEGDLVLPSSDQYASAIKRWSTLAEQPAGIVASPQHEKDVSLVITFAVSQGLEIAVKGEPQGANP